MKKAATYRIAGNPERVNMTAAVVKWFINEEFDRGNKVYEFEVIAEATNDSLRNWSELV